MIWIRHRYERKLFWLPLPVLRIYAQLDLYVMLFRIRVDKYIKQSTELQVYRGICTHMIYCKYYIKTTKIQVYRGICTHKIYLYTTITRWNNTYRTSGKKVGLTSHSQHPGLILTSGTSRNAWIPHNDKSRPVYMHTIKHKCSSCLNKIAITAGIKK